MVSRGPVGRPLEGAKRKDHSVTGVRAYIAARLAGQLDQGFLTADLGVALSVSAVFRASRELHWRPPNYKPRGRAAGGPPRPSGTALRDWLAVRTAELQLSLGLVTFPVSGASAQRELYRALQAVLGVVHLVRAGDGPGRRVVALVVTDGDDDRRRLRAELDEFADDWEWSEVDDETVEPAIATWRNLALAAARSEDLLAN